MKPTSLKGPGQAVSDLLPGTVAVLGIPFDENSSFMRGPEKAPGRIREALHGGSSNPNVQAGVWAGFCANGRGPKSKNRSHLEVIFT